MKSEYALWVLVAIMCVWFIVMSYAVYDGGLHYCLRIGGGLDGRITVGSP